MKKKLLFLGLIIAALALTGCERPTPPMPEEPVIEQNDPAPADFEYETNGGAITLTKYTGRDASPVIPATIEGVRVTAIGESAFAANRAVQTVVIPEGVTAIGAYAFECCTQLGEVTLPSTLRSIGEGAFNGCMLLGKADIPEGVTEIGNGAFMYCRALKSASLPSTLESVGDFMFAECDALAAVSLGEGIGKISERMFWRCKSLDNVTIPSSVREIGATAFSRCETLSNITVPDSVQSIGKYAFYYCEALREINFPAYIVRESTFAHCFALESVTLSPDVKIIENEAFRFTALSSTFALPDGIESIGECAFAESKLEGFELSIFNENYAVEDGVLFTRDMKTLVCYPPAKNTVSYDVPWGVETIGVHAFT
ncbi:MAG: leucine-rich repeat domain-containing protein, partial [Oscillospiraceae bacterium]|nr:leucine-rich repeat domain-containing protein [Oscillospiraceae bacterium]